MARISGVEIEDNLRIDYALTKLKGIGWVLSKKVLASLKIDPSKKVSEIKADEIAKITAGVEAYPIEGELARVVRGNILRLKQISSYRGVRHTRGLPSRGQRTRTNARTKRGKRKTVGAFKKEVLATKTQASNEKAASK